MASFTNAHKKIPFLVNGVTNESYWTNERTEGKYKTWGNNWKESAEFQCKTCVVCGETTLLADRCFVAKQNRTGNLSLYGDTPLRFFRGMTCSIKCSIELQQMTRRLTQYPEFDRDKLLSLIRDFRVSLGLRKGDTPTTFKPWDLIKITKKTNGSMGPGKKREKHPIIEPSEYAQNPQWRELMDYVFSLRIDDRMNLLGVNSRNGINMAAQLNKDYTPKNSSLFLRIVRYISKDEFLNAPLWALPSGAKMGLTRGNKSLQSGFDLYKNFNEKLLFEKIKTDMFPNGMTHEDYRQFTNHQTYRDHYRRFWWFPPLFRRGGAGHESLRGKMSTYWDFIVKLQRYVNRNERGRFLPAKFNRVDYLVNKNELHNKGSVDWTKADIRRWVFEYVFPTLDLKIDTGKFPEHSTEEELQDVINLTVFDLELVPAYWKVFRVMREKSEESGTSIRRIVEYAWPDYEMKQSAWSRMNASEKRGNQMLEKVFRYHNEKGYVYGSTTAVLVGKNKKVKYPKPSDSHIRIDGRLGRILAVEFQGCYHYVDRHSVSDGYKYDDTLFLQGDIPVSMLEYCMENGIDTPLKYRQYLDRQCRIACEENGYGTPVYVILSKHAYPVDGVHGDIPKWNRRYVTSSTCRYRDQIGLAETFDMQGREDIGDMIRDYYYNVVLNEEE